MPLGSRAGLRATGNAVPPPLAKALMACAVTAAQSLLETLPPAQELAPPAPPAQQEPVLPKHERRANKELAGLRRKLRRLTKRVNLLEGCDQGALDD